MSLTMIVTNAGRAALVNAANTGTAPVTIASCGITASAVVPAVGATALPGEIKRIATLSGDVVADDTIHLVVRDEGASVFTLRSFALYLADGTLFALYGQAAPILEKSAQSIMLLALDVRFADVAAASLTFGDANFLNPPATPEQIGVVELATLAEQLAGTDDRRVAAVNTIKDAVFSWLDARFGANNAGIWHPGNDGAGSGLDADLLDGQQGSYYANIPARLGYSPANKVGDTFSGTVAAPTFLINGLSNAGLSNNSGHLILIGDSDDYYQFDRVGNSHNFYVGNVLNAYINNSGYVVSRLGFNVSGSVVWHAGNDGSGSGLDADTVDGRHAASFMTLVGDDIVAGRKTFKANRTGNSGMNTATSGLGEIEVQGNGTGAAMMTFHRPGSHAAYFGLDSDNSFRVGGWSMGALAYRIWHEGNDGAGSGLDADTLDGVQAAAFAVKTGDSFSGDVTIYRSATPSTGVLFLGNSGARYLYYDGDHYNLPGAELYGNGGGKMWHSLNDGSGSGLDADTLDGVQGSGFFRREADAWQSSGEGQQRLYFASNSTTYFGTGDSFVWRRNDGADLARLANDGHFTTAGQITSGGGVVNVGSGVGFYLSYNGGNPIVNFDANDYIQFTRGGNQYSFIVGGGTQASLAGDGIFRAAGGFTAGGNTVWHAGNDGSGSGLDADTLDGRHASDFALIDGFTSGSNGNGYWSRRPDGVIEQWGRYPTSGGETFYTVTFPIPFTVAASISISATAILRNSVDDVWPSISGAPTTENFTVLQNAIGSSELTNGFHWRAIGV